MEILRLDSSVVSCSTDARDSFKRDLKERICSMHKEKKPQSKSHITRAYGFGVAWRSSGWTAQWSVLH
jgi:hypothetical protein